MESILEKSIGKTVGINSDNPLKFNEAMLMAVDKNKLTVRVGNNMFHYPTSGIISIVEPEEGLKLGQDCMWNDIVASTVITINHLTINKGAIGVLGVGIGFSV